MLKSLLPPSLCVCVCVCGGRGGGGEHPLHLQKKLKFLSIKQSIETHKALHQSENLNLNIYIMNQQMHIYKYVQSHIIVLH